MISFSEMLKSKRMKVKENQKLWRQYYKVARLTAAEKRINFFIEFILMLLQGCVP